MVAKINIAAFLLLSLLLSFSVQADEKLKPFILASVEQGDVNAIAESVKAKLTSAGFEIAGEYIPYVDTKIMVITSPALKQAAAQSEFGGYAAGQRVSVTKVGDEIQVAYTNPTYMAYAYRMKGDLADVTKALSSALGTKEAYGPAEGLTPKEARKYHYMFGMEYFDEPSLLAEYKSHEDAVNAVEKSLMANKGGASKVARIDVPGKDESVFAVALHKGCSSDKFIMGHIDFKPIRSTPHLPYEMLVSGKKVYALYARFRIAINFPDLKMMGDNSFFKIMCAPDAIENALIYAAGSKPATYVDEEF